MKKADKSGAKIALIMGEDEVANNKVSIKYLRQEREQETVSSDELINYLVESL
jgi:histidyl-tRNA synthetase